MGAKRPSASDRVLARERAAKVIQLRISGVSGRAIAEHLGITPARVSQILKQHLEESNATITRDTETLKALRRDQIEFVMQKHAGKLGDPRSADIYLKAAAQLTKLDGLNSPDKVEATGKDGAPVSAPPALVITFDDSSPAA